MKDRFGFEHCDGYKREDFTLCPRCLAYNLKGFKEHHCPMCGGYGEIRIDTEIHTTANVRFRFLRKILSQIAKATSYIRERYRQLCLKEEK